MIKEWKTTTDIRNFFDSPNFILENYSFLLKWMYVLNIYDDYASFINCSDNENDEIIIILRYLLLSMPNGVFYYLLLF